MRKLPKIKNTSEQTEMQLDGSISSQFSEEDLLYENPPQNRL